MDNKYTWDDIIISPYDPRIEIGAKYFCCDTPAGCLDNANRNDQKTCRVLIDVCDDDGDCPFETEEYFVNCIIRESTKSVPFDFSKEYVRDKLRNTWVKDEKGNEFSIISFSSPDSSDDEWMAVLMSPSRIISLTAKQMFEVCKFINGTPCGEITEEKNNG